MFDFRSGRHALGFCAAVAILAGCGGSQAQMAAPSVVSPAASHVRTASGSGNCPALPGGTGILTDGDFSQAPDPGSEQGLPAGTKFASDWVVSGAPSTSTAPTFRGTSRTGYAASISTVPVPRALARSDMGGFGRRLTPRIP